MPGAYLRATVTGTKCISLLIDGRVNRGCPPHSLPVVEYSIDEGAFQSQQLQPNQSVYAIALASELDSQKPHRIEIYFRAADLSAGCWHTDSAHLRLSGLQMDARARVFPPPRRPRLAISFGDSITEGVGVNGLFTSWQQLEVNNARTTWLSIVAATLDCEYGQLGSGGQGIAVAHELPPLGETWDRYDAKTSRLTDGRLVPEPDFVFCAMGTNDFNRDVTESYLSFLGAMRKACPNARFFCIVPPLGFHEGEITAVVAKCNQAGDAKVHLIDIARLRTSFRVGQGATQLAADGVHPTTFGQAMLGGLIATQVQQVLDQAQATTQALRDHR